MIEIVNQECKADYKGFSMKREEWEKEEVQEAILFLLLLRMTGEKASKYRFWRREVVFEFRGGSRNEGCLWEPKAPGISFSLGFLSELWGPFLPPRPCPDISTGSSHSRAVLLEWLFLFLHGVYSPGNGKEAEFSHFQWAFMSIISVASEHMKP